MRSFVYYTIFYNCFTPHVLGSTHIFFDNTSWREANAKCISKRGILANSQEVICSQSNLNTYLNNSFWLGGYQTSRWLQPLGCFYTIISPTPTAVTIQACLKDCKTKYIGHLNNRCTCFNSIPANKTSHSRCNMHVQSNDVTMAYEDIELHTNSGSSDCLKLHCNKTHSILSFEPCSTRLRALCEKSKINDTAIIGTQEGVENTCDRYHFSLLKVDGICSDVDKDGQTYWTGIRRYRVDQFANRKEIDNKAIIGNCNIGICPNNAVTITVSKVNCKDHLSAYACKIEDEFTSTTTRSSNSKVIESILNTKSQTVVKVSLHRTTLTMKTMFTPEKTSLTTVATTTANVIPTVKYETTESTSTGNMSSSYSQTNPLIRVTEMDGRGSPSRFDSSDNDINGIAIGVVITLLISVVTIAATVLYLRRRVQRNTESSSLEVKDSRNRDAISNNLNTQSNKLSSKNYESPWDTSDNKTNSLVLEHAVTSFHNDSTNRVDKTVTDFKMYTVVYKHKKEITTQNEDIYNRDDVHEGDYDRINLVFKPTDKDLSSDNIYDITFGARESNDYTYSSTNHAILKDNIKDLYS